jgi:hypothetical protein
MTGPVMKFTTGNSINTQRHNLRGHGLHIKLLEGRIFSEMVLRKGLTDMDMIMHKPHFPTTAVN